MIPRIEYEHFGIRYVFVDASGFRLVRSPRDAALRFADHAQARALVEAMARRAPALFERLCRELDLAAARHAYLDEDPRVEPLLRALGLALAHARDCEPPAFARVYLLRETANAQPTAQPDSPQAQAIDRILGRLESVVLMFRGARHRFARAARLASVRERDSFETLSSTEALAVLRAWTAEPSCPEAQRQALSDLLALADEQIAKRGNTELIVLRRTRALVRPGEPAAPALTPTQLRKETHWIEIQAVDEDERPISAVELEFVLADGRTARLSTDGDGFARLQPIPAGEVLVRVTALDGARWRPLGGAGARASGARGATRRHLVRQGECMAKIAHRHGLSDWTLVWNASENEALRKKRKDPNVLLPGDALVLPGIEIYEIARASDAPHRIELRTRAETKLRLRLQDIDHEALADVEYELSFTLAGRLTLRPGRAPTDASGWLEELLPLHARDVTLHLRKPALSLPVALGELDPLQDEESKKPHPSGVAQRLAALGYAPGWSSDRVGLLAFQSDELDEAARDGALNAKTMGTLQELYGA